MGICDANKNCYGYCNNGRLDPGEECDTGDNLNSAACNEWCKIRSGWTCTGSPSHCTLTPTAASSSAAAASAAMANREDIVLDNTDRGFMSYTGTWSVSSVGYGGSQHVHAAGSQDPNRPLEWGGWGVTRVPEGRYGIYATWEPGSIYSKKVTLEIDRSRGLVSAPSENNRWTRATINQQSAPSASWTCNGRKWQYFGNLTISGDYNYVGVFMYAENGAPRNSRFAMDAFILAPSDRNPVCYEEPVCGNNTLEGSEECDGTAGSCPSGKACNDSCFCQSTGPVCGNGSLENSNTQTPETCDDGNVNPNDGCSAQCAIESGWTCRSVCTSVCRSICTRIVQSSSSSVSGGIGQEEVTFARQYTNVYGNRASLSWSPDQRYVAYTRRPSTQANEALYLLDTQMLTRREIPATIQNYRSFWQPHVLLDGRAVGVREFMSYGDTDNMTSSMWIYDTTTKQRILIASVLAPGSTGKQEAFTRDAQHAAFLSQWTLGASGWTPGYGGSHVYFWRRSTGRFEEVTGLDDSAVVDDVRFVELPGASGRFIFFYLSPSAGVSTGQYKLYDTLTGELYTVYSFEGATQMAEDILGQPTQSSSSSRQSSVSSSATCAESGQIVYASPALGPTACCSSNDGIKPLSWLLGGRCQSPISSVAGSCVSGWSQMCGNGQCDSKEDQCTCPSDCHGSAPACGDGQVLSPEQCDDGNILNGDGCSNCRIDTGWSCTGSPSRCTGMMSSSSSVRPACGNGKIEGSEQCEVGIVCPPINCLVAPCPQQRCDYATCSCEMICPDISVPTCAGGVLFPQIGTDENGCQRPPVCCEGAASGGQCTTNMSCTNGKCVVDSCSCNMECAAPTPPLCPGGVLFPQIGTDENGCQRPPVCCAGAASGGQCTTNMSCTNGKCVVDSCTCGYGAAQISSQSSQASSTSVSGQLYSDIIYGEVIPQPKLKLTIDGPTYGQIGTPYTLTAVVENTGDLIDIATEFTISHIFSKPTTVSIPQDCREHRPSGGQSGYPVYFTCTVPAITPATPGHKLSFPFTFVLNYQAGYCPQSQTSMIYELKPIVIRQRTPVGNIINHNMGGQKVPLLYTHRCDSSSSSKKIAVCGNGIMELPEWCDDGNTAAGDGCYKCLTQGGFSCTKVVGKKSICTRTQCGNGIVDTGEVCDDGNVVGNDGCGGDCKVERGFSCVIFKDQPSRCSRGTCGNGRWDLYEDCDDGNKNGGDGCSAACKYESGWVCPGYGSPCIRSTTFPTPKITY